MKKLLLVLILLGMSVPAIATVYVYNIKATDTGIYTDNSGVTWTKYNDPYGGYLIVGPGSTEDKVYIWAIWTWKYGREKGGWVEDWGDVNLVQADIPDGAKTKWSWIISDVNNEYRTLLTGEMKVKKIGSAKSASCLGCHDASELLALGDVDPNIPATLTGYVIWDYIQGDPFTYRDLYTSKMTLTLNSKKTLENHVVYGNFDADSVKDELYYELQQAGYF